MIKYTAKKNETVTANEREMEALRKIFPSCFADGGKTFDIDKFKSKISDKVNITRDGYELRFLGKSYAKLLAALDTETIIAPDEEHNNAEENKNSQNLYISGDNIDALKHLLMSYAGKIKCIYIDPPYNTGSDGFVYNDKFSFTAEDLAERLGLDYEQAEKLLEFTAKKNASHSAWLLFMYPRLLLARDLLIEDGVIFISIDDNEQANLKLICDEVFGESNFVACVTWQRNYAPISLKNFFSESHEYALVYAKNVQSLSLNLLPRTKQQNKDYKNPDNDPRGVWKVGNLTVGPAVEKQIYEIIGPTGKSFFPPKGYCWRFTKEKFAEMRKDNRIWFGANGENSPVPKLFLTEVQNGVTPTTLWTHEEAGHNQIATRELRDLFDSAVFTSPKPVKYIIRFMQIGTNSDDIILDFFSGSATTAHAVMQLNAEDGGNRKFIMVQIPEDLDEKLAAKKSDTTAKNCIEFLDSINKPHTLDQIGMERIKRAAAKIRAEHPDCAADLGFKHYTIKELPQDTLDKLYDFDPDFIVADQTIADAFGTNTILATWLVRDGYGFFAHVKELSFNDYTAYWCENHLYLIPSITDEKTMTDIMDKFAEAEFNPQNIVMFGYNFTYTQIEFFRTNAQILRDTAKNLAVNLDIRY